MKWVRNISLVLLALVISTCAAGLFYWIGYMVDHRAQAVPDPSEVQISAHVYRVEDPAHQVTCYLTGTSISCLETGE